MSKNELDKSIEELEAEVIAELEEANSELDEAKTKQPNDSGMKAQPADKVDGERQDMGPAVVSPDAKSDPGKAASSKAKEVSGDAQQKSAKEEPKKKQGSSGESTPGEPKKLAAGDEVDHDGDDLAETPKTKADHLEMFGKMKASEVREMLAAYQSSLNEKAKEDDEEEEEDEDEEAVENAKKEAVELRIREIDVSEDVSALVSDEDSLSEEFKEKATTIFEAAVKSRVRSEVERIVEETAEEKKVEMETFKDELTEKVDTYLNYVVDEWSKENELAIERGLKGEIAEDFISGLQQLFQDHYIDVPDEKYDVLEAQSEKISELEDRLNEEIQKNVEIKEANSGLVREQVISEVSEDLADTEVEKFKTLTSDLDFSDEDTFREKLNTIKENYFPKVVVEDNVSDDETDGSAQDIVTSASMEKYMTAISRNKARAS